MRMILCLLLPLLAATSAMVGRDIPSEIRASMATDLFTFDRADEAAWEVVNDGVMGGRSEGFVAIDGGTLRFTGTLVTRGGGFTSIRTARNADLSAYDGLELRVRGNGRSFELAVDDGYRAYGRTVSRRASFPTSETWTVVRVPFRALGSTIFGRTVTAPAIDRAAVRGIGFFIADGRDGPFQLEVDWIRPYVTS